MLRLVVVLSLIACGGDRQHPAASDDLDIEPTRARVHTTAIVRVCVRDRATGAAVPDVEVSLAVGDQPRVGTTGINGAVELGGVSPGEYHLTLRYGEVEFEGKITVVDGNDAIMEATIDAEQAGKPVSGDKAPACARPTRTPRAIVR